MTRKTGKKRGDEIIKRIVANCLLLFKNFKLKFKDGIMEGAQKECNKLKMNVQQQEEQEQLTDRFALKWHLLLSCAPCYPIKLNFVRFTKLNRSQWHQSTIIIITRTRLGLFAKNKAKSGNGRNSNNNNI